MRIQVIREEFLKAMGLVSRFVSMRAQIPILGNVYLGTHKSRLSLRATNLEMSVSTSIGAKVKEQGEVAVPARVVNELISNLSGETIDISVDGENVAIETEGGKASVSGMNVVDFPDFPVEINKGSVSFDNLELGSALKKVIFSVSTDDSRPVLTGVNASFGKGGVEIVASDGFRLSRKKLAVDVSDKKMLGKSFIVPRGLIGELLRMGEKGKLSLFYDEANNLLVFGISNIVFSTRLIEGNYPDVEKIIPSEFDTRLKVNVEEFMKSIRAAAVFARDAGNVVTLKTSEGVLEVSSVSPQYGEQSNRLEVNSEGKEQTILFNYKYLEDILNVVGGDIIVEMVNDTSPVVFRDPEDEEYLHLIMPVKG